MPKRKALDNGDNGELSLVDSLLRWTGVDGGASRFVVLERGGQRNLAAKEKILKGDIILKVSTSKIVVGGEKAELLRDSWTPGGESNVVKNRFVKVYDVGLAWQLLELRKADSSNPYIRALPEMSFFKTFMPICWSEPECFLRGSAAFLESVSVLREELRRAFQHCESHASWDESISFDDFLWAWCVISSRSFKVSTTDGSRSVEGCIPVMDFCNHRRPRDCSYHLELSPGDGSHGFVVLTALRDIDAGGEVCVTYGAKGNRDLLRDYGFCMPPSFEPDGSSNDVMTLKVNGKLIDLRRPGGGAAYTCSCFSSGVSAFNEGCDEEASAFFGPEEDHWNLDDDDEEEEEEGDGDMYAPIEGLGEEEEEGSPEARGSSLHTHVFEAKEKVSSFEATLRSAIASYDEEKPRFAAVMSEPAATAGKPEYFCALLSMGELETLEFYRRAAHLVGSAVCDGLLKGKGVDLSGVLEGIEWGDDAGGEVQSLVEKYSTLALNVV